MSFPVASNIKYMEIETASARLRSTIEWKVESDRFHSLTDRFFSSIGLLIQIRSVFKYRERYCTIQLYIVSI